MTVYIVVDESNEKLKVIRVFCSHICPFFLSETFVSLGIYIIFSRSVGVNTQEVPQGKESHFNDSFENKKLAVVLMGLLLFSFKFESFSQESQNYATFSLHFDKRGGKIDAV